MRCIVQRNPCFLLGALWIISSHYSVWLLGRRCSFVRLKQSLFFFSFIVFHWSDRKVVFELFCLFVFCLFPLTFAICEHGTLATLPCCYSIVLLVWQVRFPGVRTFFCFSIFVLYSIFIRIYFDLAICELCEPGILRHCNFPLWDFASYRIVSYKLWMRSREKNIQDRELQEKTSFFIIIIFSCSTLTV